MRARSWLLGTLCLLVLLAIACNRPSQSSSRDGTAVFVRVLGNTTGSHLAGAKSSYGERQEFDVRTQSARPLFAAADFVKIDAEGHEREILLSTAAEDWDGTDAMVEVGSPENAGAIFEHFRALGVNMFAQRKAWNPVATAAEMPTSHRDGSLFLSRAARMPWPHHQSSSQ